MSLESKTIDGVDVSGWTAEQIAELRALANESAIADQDANAIIAEENLPANVLAKKRKLAELKKRELADARAFKDARAKFGDDDVGSIETRLGSIIMRTATPEEDDEQSDRAKAARERGAPEEEVDFVQWDVLSRTVIHPPRERVNAIVKKHPRVKELMWKLFLGLVQCSTERALGK